MQEFIKIQNFYDEDAYKSFITKKNIYEFDGFLIGGGKLLSEVGVFVYNLEYCSDYDFNFDDCIKDYYEVDSNITEKETFCYEANNIYSDKEIMMLNFKTITLHILLYGYQPYIDFVNTFMMMRKINFIYVIDSMQPKIINDEKINYDIIDYNLIMCVLLNEFLISKIYNYV